MKRNAKKTPTESKKRAPATAAKAKGKGSAGRQAQARGQRKVAPDAASASEAPVAAPAEPEREPQEVEASELAHEPATASAAASEPAAEPASSTLPTEDAPAPAASEEAQTSGAVRRLPPVGTVLQKRDRQGQLRCECVVVEDGVRYAGTVYRSLSAAAVAAARDLGLSARAINGYTFFGLTKPTRTASANPLAALERKWDGYWAAAEAALERATAGENREQALSTIERHARVLKNIMREV